MQRLRIKVELVRNENPFSGDRYREPDPFSNDSPSATMVVGKSQGENDKRGPKAVVREDRGDEM